MNKKQRSNYNFKESMKLEDESNNQNQNKTPESFLKNEIPSVPKKIDISQPIPNKFKMDTPFLDNIDSEFNEPNFKENKKQSNPFDICVDKKEKLDNPFDTFNTNNKQTTDTNSTEILEKVLNHGFLSTKEPSSNTFKTPFD